MANRRPQGQQRRTSGPRHAKPEVIAGSDSPTVELIVANAVHVGRNGQRAGYYTLFAPQHGSTDYGYRPYDGTFGPDPRNHSTPQGVKEANLSTRENGARRLERLRTSAEAFAEHMERTGQSPDTTIEHRVSTRRKFMKRVVTGERYDHSREAAGEGWMLYKKGQEDKTPLHLPKYDKLKDKDSDIEYIHGKSGNWLIVVDEEGVMHFGDHLQLNDKGGKSSFQALGTIDLKLYKDKKGNVTSRQDEWAASGDNFSPGVVNLFGYDGEPAGTMDLKYLEGMLFDAGEAAGMMDEDQLRTQPIPQVH